MVQCAMPVLSAAALRAVGKAPALCDQRRMNQVCQTVQSGNAGSQGLAALEKLCERCRQGQETYGRDPCDKMQALGGLLGTKGNNVFNLLEAELQEISEDVKRAITQAGDDTERHQLLGTTLRVVNNNLELVRQLKKTTKLDYDPTMLEKGLIQHKSFFNEVAQKLNIKFSGHGHNNTSALQMEVHNPGTETVTLSLPAGALFAPTKDKRCQNLVLRMETTIEVKPREHKRIKLWAFCGNSNKASPPSNTELEATDFVLNYDLSSQNSVWAKTSQFQR